MRTRREYLGWVVACTLGETAGYGFAALMAGISLRLLPSPATGLAMTGALGLTILGGLLEGTCLGSAQAFRWRALGPVRPHWILVTALVAAAGWGLSALFQYGGDGSTQPSLAFILVATSGLGLVLGLGFGAAQGVLVRRRGRSFKHWMWSNALGWMLAMPVLFWAPMNVPGDASLLVIVGYGMVSGAGGGLLVGLATMLATKRPAELPSRR